MRQKIVFTALAVMMLCSGTARAQKVVTEGSGVSYTLSQTRALPALCMERRGLIINPKSHRV